MNHTATQLATAASGPLVVTSSGGVLEGLDRARALFESGQPNDAMHAIRVLRDAMNVARREFAGGARWQAFVYDRVRAHPVFRLAHEDPFVERAFEKPRGYAGDAVLLDFIYRHPANRPMVAAASARGRAALGFSVNTPAPQAVRNRAWLLANQIDGVCASVDGAEILSLACGHLREAADSLALASRSAGRFLALDQDLESLEVVRREAGPLGVEAAEGSVRSVIARPGRYGRFDFIYAAGLFDYLNDRVATKLVSTFFQMLKPGATMWVANFMPGIVDRGFMESIMDWWLIYRAPEQMLELAAGIPEEACSARRIFVEPESNVVFLEIRR